MFNQACVTFINESKSQGNIHRPDCGYLRMHGGVGKDPNQYKYDNHDTDNAGAVFIAAQGKTAHWCRCWAKPIQCV